MNIKKKPREELTQKTQEFLESLTQTEQIDQKTSDKILKSLNMDKGFLSWLMKKTEVGVDIHDKKSIEKALNKILSKG